MSFFDEEDRKQLRNYKYVSGAYTFLDNLLSPIYTNLTNLFPMWVAPNVITFIALLFSMSSTILYVYYKPSFYGTAPSWIYIYAGICVVLYQALDFMDGKQARRLGVSGPLGELFDHGCDALNLFFIFIMNACAMNLGIGLTFQYTLVVCIILFYFAQITEYKTGILFHSNNNVGVTEVQLSIAIVNLLPGIFGDDIYQRNIPYINISFIYIYILLFSLVTIPSVFFLLFSYHNPNKTIDNDEMRGNKNILSTYDNYTKPLGF